MITLGILGSTRGTDLQAILNAIKSKELKAKIAIVISNNKDAYILKRATSHNIPTAYITHKDKGREIFDSEISKILKSHKVDLILLIGFMRILSSKFCKSWKSKILNVHPSLLPKYAGGMDTNVHEEVLRNKEKESGCSIHFVTDEVDSGPVLIQKRCSVDEDETVDSLKLKVQKLEGEAFLEAIPLFNRE